MTLTGDDLKTVAKVLGLSQGDVLRQARRDAAELGRDIPASYGWDEVVADPAVVSQLRRWMFSNAVGVDLPAGGSPDGAEVAGATPLVLQLPDRLVDPLVRALNAISTVVEREFGIEPDLDELIGPVDGDGGAPAPPAAEDLEDATSPHPVYDSDEYHAGVGRVEAGEHPEEVAVDVGAALNELGVEVDLDELIGDLEEWAARKRLADELGATPVDSTESPEQETADANA